MENTVYYTDNYILDEYLLLPLEQQNKILYYALDYMQSYNGRTKFKCIAMAMGYDNTEGLNTTYFKTRQ